MLRINVKAKGSGYHHGSVGTLRSNMSAALSPILKHYKQWAEHVSDNSQDVLYDILKEVYDASKELVPVDTGKLKRSGYIAKWTLGSQKGVAVGYGRGGMPEYTIFVHEMPYQHKPPTTWKFLQIPLEQMLPEIPGHVVKGLKYISGVTGQVAVSKGLKRFSK